MQFYRSTFNVLVGYITNGCRWDDDHKRHVQNATQSTVHEEKWLFCQHMRVNQTRWYSPDAKCKLYANSCLNQHCWNFSWPLRVHPLCIVGRYKMKSQQNTKNAIQYHNIPWKDCQQKRQIKKISECQFEQQQRISKYANGDNTCCSQFTVAKYNTIQRKIDNSLLIRECTCELRTFLTGVKTIGLCKRCTWTRHNTAEWYTPLHLRKVITA